MVFSRIEMSHSLFQELRKRRFSSRATQPVADRETGPYMCRIYAQEMRIDQRTAPPSDLSGWEQLIHAFSLINSLNQIVPRVVSTEDVVGVWHA